jgi:two-component system chemotaxis response regulator CheB
VSGRIYVAPNDRHLLIERGQVCVVRGPRENGHRPAIDPLFRTAALRYGPRVIGVVLTGSLDDGTAGMRAVKAMDGVCVVQDPRDAVFPSMPRNAIANVDVDHVLPLAQMGPLLSKLACERVEERAHAVPDQLDREAEIDEQQLSPGQLRRHVERIGEVTALTCPECSGSLWQLRDASPPRYRCHVGHAYSADTLVSEQAQTVESALWSAMRLLEERAMLMRRLAEYSQRRSRFKAAAAFEERAVRAEAEGEMLRSLLERHAEGPGEDLSLG